MKSLLFLFIFFLFPNINAGAQTWLWGTEGNILLPSSCEGYSVATDRAGNSYLTGQYTDSMSIGSFVLTSQGSVMFVAKYDSNGHVVWAKQGVGSSVNISFENGNSVTVDKSGDVYVTGDFIDSVAFDTIILKANFANLRELFIVKYDSNGNVIWARQSNSFSGGASGTSVTTDKNGSVFITGSLGYDVSFDTVELDAPNSCEFLAKYDKNGNFLWVRQGEIQSYHSQSIGNSVATDTKGNIYVTGGFIDTVTFGSVALLDNTHWYNTFLVKYDSIGNVLWVNRSHIQTSTSYGNGMSVTSDNAGNSYITGTYSDTISFGLDTFKSNKLANIFIVKYNANGNILWAKSSICGDSNYCRGYTITSDTLNHIYFGGTATVYPAPHKALVVFGSDTFKTFVTDQDGASLLMKLDTSGNLLCGSIVKGGGDDNNGLGVDPSGRFVNLGGDLYTSTIFGLDTLENEFAETPFMARWEGCGSILEGINQITSNEEDIKLYPNPANDIIYLQIDDDKKVESLDIVNTIGQILWYKSNSDNNQHTFEISTSNFPSDIYFLKALMQNGKILTKKFAIIR